MQAVRALTFSSKTTTSSSAAAATLRHSHSKRVFAVISNAINGSNIRWRGRSFAALVPADSSEPQRGRKRVSKDERRAMVEAFVDKYRASNAGKYPTPTAAQKQVGGSYYVVKNILQELEYNSKRSTSTTSKDDETLLEVVHKEECLISAEAREAPNSKTRADRTCSTQKLVGKKESQTIVINNMDMDEATSNSFEAREETLSSIELTSFDNAFKPQTTGDPSNSDETNNHQINEAKAVAKAGHEPSDSDKLERKNVSYLCIEDPENSTKAATSDDSLDLNEPKVVPEDGQEDSELDKLERKEVLNVCIEDPENSKKKEATDGSLDLNEPKVVRVAGQEVSESDKFERDVYRGDHQSPNSSTVWGNLRSFAEGIINMWRKM